MSRRSTKIAVVHPAFSFPCRHCDNTVVQVLKPSEEGRYHSQGTQCTECKYLYEPHELDLAHRSGVMIPCNSFHCPYCEILGIILSEEEFKINHQKTPIFEGDTFSMPWDKPNPNRRIIGAAEHESIQWTLPPLIVCEGCHKPVRLSTKGCLYIRSRRIAEARRDPNLKPPFQRPILIPEPEIRLTPKMKSF